MRKPSLSPTGRVLLALAALLTGDAAAQPPQTFSGQMDIQEREIVVELPENLRGRRLRLRPDEFQVLVDGQPREVTRAEPVSREGPAPWTVLVYVDRVLAGPGTAFYSTLALAGKARELSGLGTVEVAVAGSGATLAPTREARRIAETLAGLANQARIDRDRAGDTPSRPPSDAQVDQQLDEILAFVASRHPPGPHVLFLVAEGSEMAAPAPVAAFRRAADLLASQGWIVVPIALRPDSPGAPVAPRSEIDIFREGAASSGHSNGGPPRLPPGHGPRKSTLAFPRVVDLFTDPRIGTLHTLASVTAGTVIGYDVQLPALLEELPRRWTVWISEPAPAGEGGLHALTVKLPGRKATARAPAWLP
jgi:hypothetical protein